MLARLPTGGIARRIARALGANEEAPPRSTLQPGDGRVVAGEHLRAACHALAADGRTHAEVFGALRLLVNRLEAGGLPAAELASRRRAADERAPRPSLRAGPRLRRVLAAALAGAPQP